MLPLPASHTLRNIIRPHIRVMQLLFLSEVRVDVEERVSDMSCVRTRALAQLIGTHVFNGIGFRLLYRYRHLYATFLHEESRAIRNIGRISAEIGDTHYGMSRAYSSPVMINYPGHFSAGGCVANHSQYLLHSAFCSSVPSN